MDDLVEVQVVHAPGDTHGPVHEQGGHDLASGPQHLVQLALRAVLHEDAVAGGLGADPPESRRAQSEIRFNGTFWACKTFMKAKWNYSVQGRSIEGC